MASTVADPEVVLVAALLQIVTYTDISFLTIMVHDWLILLNEEIEHVWRRQWDAGKILFIISRYGTFCDLPIRLVMRMAPYGANDYGTCSTLYKIVNWSSVIGVSFSELILLLRTRAVYSRSKRVTIPLSILYATTILVGIIITWSYLHTKFSGPPPSPFSSSCYLPRDEFKIFIDFSLLLAFELAILILTVWKGFHDFNSGSLLTTVLYRDGISFFLILFAESVSTIVVLVLAPPNYGAIMSAATRISHSIICCRILLNLRRAATPSDHPTTVSNGMVFAIPLGKQPNQAVTIQLEAWDIQGGVEEDDGDGMGEISSLDDFHPEVEVR